MEVVGDQLKWKKRRGVPGVSAPTSYAGDYVISHRKGAHVVSHRPSGHHRHVGEFRTVAEARAAAESDRASVVHREQKGA